MKISQGEKLLVNNIIARDQRAFLSIYRLYHKPIFNFVKRQVNDYYLAEEITNDVFLDFIEALRDFHFQSSLKTFIYSIAKNKTIDFIRKKKIKKVLFSALPQYVVEGLKTILMDDEIEKKELEGKIKKALDRLPNDYRLILRLKYMEGEKVLDIARKLSLGFKATESLLFRARKSFIKVYNNLP